MAYRITEECINCGSCITECPNNAIYEVGSNWEINGQVYSEGDAAPSGAIGFYSDDFAFIVPDKCTECDGIYDEPNCLTNCPTEAIIRV